MAKKPEYPPISNETIEKIEGFVKRLNTSAEEYEHTQKALQEEIRNMQPSQVEELVGSAFNNLAEGELSGFLKNIVDSLAEYKSGETQTQDRLETLRAKGISKYLVPNTKISNLLPTGRFGEALTEVIVSKAKAKTQVTTKVMLSYDKVKIVGRQEFTAFDRVVHNAVVSLYEAGNMTFTAAMVYRTMNGLTDSEFVSPQALESVITSLDKSRFMRLCIDFTAEAKMYNQSTDKATYEGYLLAADKITVKSGGDTTEGYHLLRKPALYEYSQVSSQIITVPAKMLNTKKAVNSTEEVIVMREYLIRQIAWMKNTKSTRSHNITYQDIWDEIGLELTGQALRDKRLKLRKNIKALLETWVDEGYIKSFAEYKEGTAAKGINIIT